MAVSKLNLVFLSLSYLFVLFGITLTLIKKTALFGLTTCEGCFWKLLNSFFLNIVLLEAKWSTEVAGICLFIAVPKGLTKSSSLNFLFGFVFLELIFDNVFLFVLLFESFSVFFILLEKLEIVFIVL